MALQAICNYRDSALQICLSNKAYHHTSYIIIVGMLMMIKHGKPEFTNILPQKGKINEPLEKMKNELLGIGENNEA